MHADKGNKHNMRTVIPFSIYRCMDMGLHIIVACYHSLPLFACMLHFDLVSILFGTSIPTTFKILVKMFLHLLYVAIHITDMLSMRKWYPTIE